MAEFFVCMSTKFLHYALLGVENIDMHEKYDIRDPAFMLNSYE